MLDPSLFSLGNTVFLSKLMIAPTTLDVPLPASSCSQAVVSEFIAVANVPDKLLVVLTDVNDDTIKYYYLVKKEVVSSGV